VFVAQRVLLFLFFLFYSILQLFDVIDEDEGDTIEEMDMTDDTSSAILERCRFWPACANGIKCPYVHPTTPCK